MDTREKIAFFTFLIASFEVLVIVIFGIVFNYYGVNQKEYNEWRKIQFQQRIEKEQETGFWWGNLREGRQFKELDGSTIFKVS
jgi:predicted membrane protein